MIWAAAVDVTLVTFTTPAALSSGVAVTSAE